ncbi:hypothetical protein [Labrys miyagiensis]|uniref:hypothetical protein n=1 Tax=Labrys miyagiensis TaxID=346912 RepID=UPI0024E163A1|nr:hypothetical protein [Labrys miyagiensis]
MEDQKDKEESQQRSEVLRRQNAANACKALPTSEPGYEAATKQAWTQKRQAFEDGQTTLKALRTDLESNAEWTVGDTRQMATYLAKVTKTCTDLFSDTVGFSGEKLVAGRALRIYEGIKNGKTAYKSVTEAADKFAIDILYEQGAELSPAVRAVNAIKNLSENVQDIAKTSEEIAKAKNEVKNQLDIIDRQLSILEAKIDQINKDHVKDVAPELFAIFREVKAMCDTSPVKIGQH